MPERRLCLADDDRHWQGVACFGTSGRACLTYGQTILLLTVNIIGEKQVRTLTLALWVTLVCAPVAARPPSVPEPGAPFYSALGKLAVGRTAAMVDDGRPLALLIWYPAISAKGARPTRYQWTLHPAPTLTPKNVNYDGIAVVNAPQVKGRFPLIILSHGFGGSPQQMSYLGENLASKGYVVVGIDHADASYTDAASFQRALAQAVQYRAADQQNAIAALIDQPTALARRFGPTIDRDRVAVVGYSMGGFGALATAGAGYDPMSLALKSLPTGALATQVEGRSPDPRVKAVVAIAPWGAQAPFRAWSAKGAATLQRPMLLISGDNDDISNHADGAVWFFERATASNRWMLVYKFARHNVGGNPVPDEVANDAAYSEFFDEPVWRVGRLNALNQHFITAFLDWQVNGDASRAAMFAAPAAGANWPGFPPRSSIGFELQHRSAGQ
jgi:predicted dienelactone hydrolase